MNWFLFGVVCCCWWLCFSLAADFGLKNDVSMASLLNASAHDEFDQLILGGDIAYDLMANNSQVGNAFMNTLQPLAARMPFMTGEEEGEGRDRGVRENVRSCERSEEL